MSESILTLCQSLLNPMPESTLSPSQRLLIWPQVATNGMWPLARWSSISLYRRTILQNLTRTRGRLRIFYKLIAAWYPISWAYPIFRVQYTLQLGYLYHIVLQIGNTVYFLQYIQKHAVSRIAGYPYRL
jgi:hypothetical protein